MGAQSPIVVKLFAAANRTSSTHAQHKKKIVSTLPANKWTWTGL